MALPSFSRDSSCLLTQYAERDKEMGSTQDLVNPQEEEESCLYAMQLACFYVLPKTLKFALELDLLEIIAKAGSGAHLSPTEIAAQLPTQNPRAPVMLDRILRLLAAYNVPTCSLVTAGDGRVHRHYGLAPVCKFLTRNKDGFSMAALLLMYHDKVLMDSWHYLKDALLDVGIPFQKAHGLRVSPTTCGKWTRRGKMQQWEENARSNYWHFSWAKYCEEERESHRRQICRSPISRHLAVRPPNGYFDSRRCQRPLRNGYFSNDFVRRARSLPDEDEITA